MNYKLILVSFVLLSCTGVKEAGDSSGPLLNKNNFGPHDLTEFSQFIDSVITGQLKKENIPGAAFVFVRDGKIFYTKGYGLANVEKNIQVDPSKTIFRIGSISKVFTADALLQLADKKIIDLHEDVNNYLTTTKVPSSFNTPITVSHLLTHTAGLDEIRPGTQAPTASGLLPLNQFLKDKMIRLWSPGEIVMYSTYGITLGGLIIEEKTKQSFESYLINNICRPLQMNSTCITVPNELLENIAVGYENSNGTNIAQRWEWYHTSPASSVNSTATDMAHWLIAHMNGGQYNDQRIMSKNMMDEMLKPQFSMHPKMYGMAYGFFEEYYNNIRFLHHGGNMAGFNSLAVIIPEMNTGFFFVSQHEGSSIRDNLQWAIFDKYYKDASFVTSLPVATVNSHQRAKLFEGRYKYNVYCHTCENPAQTLTFDVSANDDGSIQLNGRKWIETEANLFIREDGKSKVGFRIDSAGAVTHMYLGGYWAFEKK